jgi:hypothetical protein
MDCVMRFCYRLLAQIRFLMARWSCSRMLFKYATGRCRQRRRKMPWSLASEMANG